MCNEGEQTSNNNNSTTSTTNKKDESIEFIDNYENVILITNYIMNFNEDTRLTVFYSLSEYVEGNSYPIFSNIKYCKPGGKKMMEYISSKSSQIDEFKNLNENTNILFNIYSMLTNFGGEEEDENLLYEKITFSHLCWHISTLLHKGYKFYLFNHTLDENQISQIC